MSTNPIDGAMRTKKRDRSEAFDEIYTENKKILHDGFRSLSLQEPLSQNPAVGQGTGAAYTLHQCVGHDLFRMDSAGSCDTEISKESGNHGTEIAIQKMQSFDSVASQDSADSDGPSSKSAEREYFVSVLRGGQRKYVRKVDYLVEELIRKSRKLTEINCLAENPDCVLPPYVGPSPRTDHALSIIVPFSTDVCSLSSQAAKAIEPHLLSTAVSEGGLHHLSGEVTHGDWGMEEILPLQTTNHDRKIATGSMLKETIDSSLFDSDGHGEDDNDSNMAQYEMHSERCSTRNSLSSGGSGMAVESDDEILAGSNRSVLFDESSSINGRYDLSRLSPWSAASLRTAVTRSVAADEEEDDAENVGTF